QASSSITVSGSYSGLLEWQESEEESIPLVDSDTDEIPPSGAVLLTDATESAWIADALRSGVKAILPRTAGGPEIIAAIEAAAVSLNVLHPDITQSLLPGSAAARRDIPLTPQQHLTPRDIEVLALLSDAQGKNTIDW